LAGEGNEDALLAMKWLGAYHREGDFPDGAVTVLDLEKEDLKEREVLDLIKQERVGYVLSEKMVLSKKDLRVHHPVLKLLLQLNLSVGDDIRDDGHPVVRSWRNLSRTLIQWRDVIAFRAGTIEIGRALDFALKPLAARLAESVAEAVTGLVRIYTSA